MLQQAQEVHVIFMTNQGDHFHVLPSRTTLGKRGLNTLSKYDIQGSKIPTSCSKETTTLSNLTYKQVQVFNNKCQYNVIV